MFYKMSSLGMIFPSKLSYISTVLDSPTSAGTRKHHFNKLILCNYARLSSSSRDVLRTLPNTSDGACLFTAESRLILFARYLYHRVVHLCRRSCSRK